MKPDINKIAPEHTAVRVALWRALHVLIDPAPHVFTDDVGAKLVGDSNWRDRPDMNPEFSKSMRASITGRARFIEDLVTEEISKGVDQYVILGAGLDTFAVRRPDLASKIHVFEVDQPGPQEWKKRRLSEEGYALSSKLHFVPVDFEAGHSWWDKLLSSGLDPSRPAVVVSTGVSMYLSRESNQNTLNQLTKLAPGSTFAMTFLIALELMEEKERSMMEFVMKKAQESGTPFLSLFRPEDLRHMATQAGFTVSQYVPASELYLRYFSKRTDHLNAGTAEGFLVCKMLRGET